MRRGPESIKAQRKVKQDDRTPGPAEEPEDKPKGGSTQVREGSGEKEDEQRPGYNWDRVFAGVVAAFAVVTGLVAIAQFWATQTAVRIASDSLGETRRAIKVANRAWLVKGRLSDLEVLEPEAEQEIFLPIENVGNTAATNIKHLAVTLVAEDVKSVDLNFDCLPGMGDMGPRQKTRLVANTSAMPPDVVEKIRSGDGRKLFVLARLEYQAGFGVTGRTNICAYWEPASGRFNSCLKFNDLG